jgi:hypothetical protein
LCLTSTTPRHRIWPSASVLHGRCARGGSSPRLPDDAEPAPTTRRRRRSSSSSSDGAFKADDPRGNQTFAQVSRFASPAMYSGSCERGAGFVWCRFFGFVLYELLQLPLLQENEGRGLWKEKKEKN